MNNELLFIAGPMTGYPDRNLTAFLHAERVLNNVGYVAINPAHIERFSDDIKTERKDWVWMQRNSIRVLTYATGVALLPGWNESDGVKLATHIAKTLKIPVLSVDEWIDKAADFKAS